MSSQLFCMNHTPRGADVPRRGAREVLELMEMLGMLPSNQSNMVPPVPMLLLQLIGPMLASQLSRVEVYHATVPGVPINKLAALTDHIAQGNLDEAAAVLESLENDDARRALLGVRNNLGETVLHLAFIAASPSVRIIRLLIEKGATFDFLREADTQDRKKTMTREIVVSLMKKFPVITPEEVQEKQELITQLFSAGADEYADVIREQLEGDELAFFNDELTIFQGDAGDTVVVTDSRVTRGLDHRYSDGSYGSEMVYGRRRSRRIAARA